MPETSACLQAPAPGDLPPAPRAAHAGRPIERAYDWADEPVIQALLPGALAPGVAGDDEPWASRVAITLQLAAWAVALVVAQHLLPRGGVL